MVDEDRQSILTPLQENIQYRFKDFRLLNKALTHKSFVNENNNSIKHNERFEFLGDSVLDLIVSDYIIVRYADYAEGVLSKIRAAVVNETCLAALARGIDLGQYLQLGRGEDLSGGRNKPSLLANAFEALAGAVYLDSNLESAANVFLPLLKQEIDAYSDSWDFHDYKSELQELTQNKMLCIPTYRVVRETGPDHDKRFDVVVLIKDVLKGQGVGRSKKEAEQAAAQEALNNFTIDPA